MYQRMEEFGMDYNIKVMEMPLWHKHSLEFALVTCPVSIGLHSRMLKLLGWDKEGSWEYIPIYRL